jgi:hypothetical protein
MDRRVLDISIKIYEKKAIAGYKQGIRDGQEEGEDFLDGCRSRMFGRRLARV